MVFKNKPLAQIALSSIELQFRLEHIRPSYLGGYIGQRLEGQHESGAGGARRQHVPFLLRREFRLWSRCRARVLPRPIGTRQRASPTLWWPRASSARNRDCVISLLRAWPRLAHWLREE